MERHRDRVQAPVVVSFSSESARQDAKTGKYTIPVPLGNIGQSPAGYRGVSIQTMEMGMGQRTIESDWRQLYVGEGLHIDERNQTVECGGFIQFLPLTTNYVTSVQAHGPMLHVRTAYPNGLFCKGPHGRHTSLRNWSNGPFRLTIQTATSGIVELELTPGTVARRVKYHNEYVFILDMPKGMAGAIAPETMNTPSDWLQCGTLCAPPIQSPAAFAELLAHVTSLLGGGNVVFDERRMVCVQTNHSHSLTGGAATYMGLDGAQPAPFMQKVRMCEMRCGDYGKYGECRLGSEWSMATNPLLIESDIPVLIMVLATSHVRHEVIIPPGNYTAESFASVIQDSLPKIGHFDFTITFNLENSGDGRRGRFCLSAPHPFEVEFNHSPKMAELMGFVSSTLKGQSVYSSDRAVCTADCPFARKPSPCRPLETVESDGTGGQKSDMERGAVEIPEHASTTALPAKCLATIGTSGKLILSSRAAVPVIELTTNVAGGQWAAGLRCTTPNGTPLHSGLAPHHPLLVTFGESKQPPVHMLCARAEGDVLTLFSLAYDGQGAPVYPDIPAPSRAYPVAAEPVYYIQRCAELPRCIKPRILGIGGVVHGSLIVGRSPVKLEHPHVAFVQLSATGADTNSTTHYICGPNGTTAPYHMKLIFHPQMRCGGDGGHPLVLTPTTPLQTLHVRLINEDLTSYVTNDDSWSLTVAFMP